MEIKIDETYHVASYCCPSYAHKVLGKIVSFIFPTLVKWKGRRQTAELTHRPTTASSTMAVTYYTHHPGAPSSVPLLNWTASGCHFSRLKYKFCRVCWLRVASWRFFSGFTVLEKFMFHKPGMFT